MATLSVPQKAKLAIWMWSSLVRSAIALRRHPLPRVIARLVQRPTRCRSAASLDPARLSRASYRALAVRNRRPRCLLRALVLLELLRAQGRPAVLVIGLPEEAVDQDAHAWVELDGVDVGPPPGSAGHLPLVRYPEPPVRTGADMEGRARWD